MVDVTRWWPLRGTPMSNDGFLVGAPGFHLPKAAVEQMWKVQQYASIATGTIASGADAGQPDIFDQLSLRRNSSCRSRDPREVRYARRCQGRHCL